MAESKSPGEKGTSPNNPARHVPRGTPESTPAGDVFTPDDPTLAAVVTAWPDLPEAVRVAIGQLVQLSAGRGGR